MMLVSLASPAQILTLGDVNRDGEVNVVDVTELVNIILKGYVPFNVTPSTVTLSAGGTATLSITGGYSFYEVIPANTDVVEASVFGLTVTLTAKSGGETTVTVKDVLTFRTIDIPVIVDYNSLQLGVTELSLIVGEQGTVDITSGSGYYSVESSDEGIATAQISGGKVTVTAVSAGTAAITVTDTKSGETASFEVTVNASVPSLFICPDNNHPHMIDLGLPSGTKWACCNVGATAPEDYGGYYAWGETDTKSTYNWSTYIHCEGSYDTCHDLDSNIAGTQYDVAYVKWGGSWVMPTDQQQQELLNNCTYTWTTMNGVNGGLFTGLNGGKIFLPAAGYRYGSDLRTAGSNGYYWSSTQYPSNANIAYDLYFDSGSTDWFSSNRSYGQSVRPVVSN